LIFERLALNSISSTNIATVESDLRAKILRIAANEEVTLIGETSAALFESLIGVLNKKTGRKVAVLIDEYDYPILA
jgi:hypothetical protein